MDRGKEIFMPPSVKELLDTYRPDHSFPTRYLGKVYTDTTEFSRISYGDVIALGGKHYFVLRDEAERRFGLEDPKYWVKRCTCLETSESHILKLVFYEQFPVKIGTVTIECFRSPRKEARILDRVRGDWRFMQGESYEDSKGNNVRILELIRGRRLDERIEEMQVDHQTYFFEHFPAILEKFITSCEAIGFLHEHGEKHGDIRRDHLWLEHKTGRYRWIDFDYAYKTSENPFRFDIFGLGQILLFLAGKGNHTLQNLTSFPGVDSIAFYEEDFALLFRNRLVNLKRIYPYVPEQLNFILLHFSVGANIFYETVDEFLDDLRPCLDLIRKGA